LDQLWAARRVHAAQRLLFVVVTALEHNYVVTVYQVHESMFLGDPAGVGVWDAVLETLGLADPIERITQAVVD
jgi:hypothetical protein